MPHTKECRAASGAYSSSFKLLHPSFGAMSSAVPLYSTITVSHISGSHFLRLIYTDRVFNRTVIVNEILDHGLHDYRNASYIERVGLVGAASQVRRISHGGPGGSDQVES